MGRQTSYMVHASAPSTQQYHCIHFQPCDIIHSPHFSRDKPDVVAAIRRHRWFKYYERVLGHPAQHQIRLNFGRYEQERGECTVSAVD